MKKFLFLLPAAFALLASSPGPEVRITGTWTGEGSEGATVYLMRQQKDGTLAAVDSTRVKEGAFSFCGPQVCDKRVVLADKAKKDVMLWERPVNVRIETKYHGEGEKRRPSTWIEVDGDPEQDVLRSSEMLGLAQLVVSLGGPMTLAKETDPVVIDSLLRQIEQANVEMKARIKNLLDSTTNRYASTVAITKLIVGTEPLETAKAYYDRLSPQVKSSDAGKTLLQRLQDEAQIAVGGTAPDIELPGPDGQAVKLSSLKGKYVLLDFWASWCKPCLAEAPNVKAVYEKYRAKGFEVYGVSIDDKAEPWKRAIQVNGLGWIHVSSLKGWKCPAAVRYGVTGVPATFLIDPQGKIIAVNLRGERLAAKMDEIFEGK